MKKILFLFLIVLLSGCVTVKYIEVPVPIEVELDESQLPVREVLTPKEEDESMSQFLLRRVVYYSELVEIWESWGIYVYEVLDLPIPESLNSIVIKNENS